MSDPRLTALREKDPVIGTYHADSLVQSPTTVEQTYSVHATTHMAMGDTSTFVDKLIHWTRYNRGCVVGAIAGPYGYGKTSTAVHLWRECEQHGVIAVPPFSWRRLEDIMAATHAWVEYRLGQIAPDQRGPLTALYERYQQQSLAKLAAETGVSHEGLHDLLQRGRLNLSVQPSDVIQFLAEVSALLGAVDRDGPVVFTDELQVTLSEYPTRDQFMDDLFGLLRELRQRQGSYGLVMSMPTATEALIADVRGDIIERLQDFKFYLRPETLYDRRFAEDLWRKYAHLFGFTEVMSQILPGDTLRSIGQIASRRDLGSGPRSVVDAFRRAIHTYDESGTPYFPFDLIDDYIGGEVAFDQMGKLSHVTREALQAAPVAGDDSREAAIKLLAAFPEGCPEEVQHFHRLAGVIADLPPAYRREYLYDFAEGPSLRKLAPTEVKADPVFLRLTKEFVGRYSADTPQYTAMAQCAFERLVLRDIVFQERRGAALTGWTWKSETRLVGSFSERYPERELALRVVLNPDIAEPVGERAEFSLWVYLDVHGGPQDAGEVRKMDSDRRTIVRLNLAAQPRGPLPVAYLSDLGVATAKVTPRFMLALLQHLEENRSAIPNEEQARGMRTFSEQLLSQAVALLFSDELRAHSDWPLTYIHSGLLKDVVNQMCEAVYPQYVTLMTLPRWDDYLTHYINALKNARVTPPIARGAQPLAGTKDEITRLFGQANSNAFQNFQRSLPHLLDFVNWSGRERGAVQFTLHPLEQAIRDLLDASPRRLRQGGVEVGALAVEDIMLLGEQLGYRRKEIEFAIRLLEARRYITQDPRTHKLTQLIESPEEHRALLDEKLQSLHDDLAVLRKAVSAFNVEKYSGQLASLSYRAEHAGEAHDLQALHAEAIRVRTEFNEQVERNIQAGRRSLTELIQTYEPYTQGQLVLPAASDSPPVAAWSRFLPALAAELQERTQTLAEGAANLVAQAQTLLKEVEGAETPLARLSKLHQGQIPILRLKSSLEKRREEAQSDLAALEAWRELLPLADRVQHEVETCAATYNMPTFRDQYAALEALVAARVAAGDALPLAGQVRADLEHLNRATLDWIAAQREQFLDGKRDREKVLAELGGREVHLRSGFDHYRPSESLRDLDAEMREELGRMVRDLGRALDRVRGDVAYLGLIMHGQGRNLPDVRPAEKAVSETRASFEAQPGLDGQSLEAWAEQFRRARDAVRRVRRQVAEGLEQQPPTSREALVLDQLAPGRTLELGEIVRVLAQNGRSEAFSLAQLMTDIQSLFQKNQVIIKLERRKRE